MYFNYLIWKLIVVHWGYICRENLQEIFDPGSENNQTTNTTTTLNSTQETFPTPWLPQVLLTSQRRRDDSDISKSKKKKKRQWWKSLPIPPKAAALPLSFSLHSLALYTHPPGYWRVTNGYIMWLRDVAKLRATNEKI